MDIVVALPQTRLKNILMNTMLTRNFVDITQNPPTKTKFIDWFNKYQNRGLRYFLDASGQHYRQMHLKDKLDSMTHEEAAELLSSDGKLIKRPLITDGENLSCGFDRCLWNLWLK